MTETASSGVDLARAAYRAARAAAKAAPQPKRRTGAAAPRRPRGGAGRDPLSFGDAISRMVTERGWELAAAGGSVLDQWPTIAPHLIGKAAAVGYDEATRTLQLLPAIPAYATQLTLYQRDIVAKINEVIGSDTVRKLEVLRPAVLTGPRFPHAATAFKTSAEPVSTEAAPGRPVGATASEPPAGYRAALAAHRATWASAKSADPQVSVAAQRQIRERVREPEARFGDGLSEVSRLRARSTAKGSARSSDAARARALKKLAEDHGGQEANRPTKP
ncbi:DciA family protein [Streptomyces clavifer]|uniref:DciA family protein n=1 Tax=Streptomyces clavifer TaxID=68188 RepID=UPI0037163E95